jgi:serine/threonine protein kinase
MEGMEIVYDEKTDVWALGCVLHELASGQLAFLTPQDVLKYCERSNEGLDFTWLETLGWPESHQSAVRTMLNMTLAVRTYFRPSAACMVGLIQDIIHDLGADNVTCGQGDMREQ